MKFVRFFVDISPCFRLYLCLRARRVFQHKMQDSKALTTDMPYGKIVNCQWRGSLVLSVLAFVAQLDRATAF